MLKLIFVIFNCLVLATSLEKALQCYHCYDSFNDSTIAGKSDSGNFGDKFIRCDKNKNKWNSMTCPPVWPVCVVIAGKVQDHYEIARSCAAADFCSKYKPPPGVKVDKCRECNSTLCNDYTEIPDPDPDHPVGPGPLFVFNININLNLRNNSLVISDDEK